jgi:hypothetical protein
VLLLLAIGLWAIGLSQYHVTRLGLFGLPPEMPVTFYAGFAVFVISATCELVRARISPWRMAVHAVVLVFMLYGTAPLVYYEGRYEWMYKTVGVVQYITAHHKLDPTIDIYQNWPGFFALVSWFDKVAGVSTALSYAKWVQVLFELAALPGLYVIYSALSLSTRQRWTAILLYSATNWIGQDYFSPQALSTVLSIGLMAIAMRWLYAGAPPTRQSNGPPPIQQRRGVDKLIGLSAEARSQRFTPRAGAVLAIAAIFSLLAITHQLSPYMLVEQLAALAAIRLLRPRWLPVLLAAIAVAYLIPRYSYVDSNYGLTKTLGHFFTNLKPPSFSAPNVAPAEKFIQRCTEVLSVGVWALAGLGAWLNRQAGRPVLGLLLLAYSPVMLLALGSYGNEGILRVYLFSLPWSVALAAMALAPARTAAAAAQPSRVAAIAARLRRAARSMADALRVPDGWRKPGVVRIPVALGVALALFFPAFFGDDAFNYMTKAEVDATTTFWLKAQSGHVYLAIDAAPVADTWRYNLFPWSPIFGSTLYQTPTAVTYSIAEQLAQRANHKSHGNAPAYVMITNNMVAFNNAYGITNPSAFEILLYSLAHDDRDWHLVLDQAGVIVYEHPPQNEHGGAFK